MNFDNFYQSPELLKQNDIEEQKTLNVPEHKKRYVICQSCDEFYPRLKMCKQCMCFMPAKVRLSGVSCPKGLW